MMNGYDIIAPLYGKMEKICFGNKLQQGRITYLHSIPSKARILIVGGGIGNEISVINDCCPHSTIDFVDSSPRMIKLARRKNNIHLNINFFDSLDSVRQSDYDFILIHFFLDQFSTDTGLRIFKKLLIQLKKEGLISFVDFVHADLYWNKLRIQLMYFFFRTMAHIEANTLPDYDRLFSCNEIFEQSRKMYLNGLIRASLYKKITPA